MKCNDSFAAVGQGAGAGACHRTGRKQKHKGLRPIPLPTLTAGLFKACTSKSENAPERDVLIWVIAQMTALPPMGTRSGVGSGFSRTTLQSARASPSLCMRRVTRRIDCSSGLRLCSVPPPHTGHAARHLSGLPLRLCLHSTFFHSSFSDFSLASSDQF